MLLYLWLLLTVSFCAVSVLGYVVTRDAIREALIGQDLPLTSSNIYSEIQKDLVRPILVSSTMAHDTFVRDWILHGERDVDAITRYLREVRERYGAFSSFLVSERSWLYYTGDGILKRVARDEPRDIWYFRVRTMTEDYEINVDPDLANKDALTIFINYRVFDFDGNYIGATGVGLTVDAVRQHVSDYQQRFARTIYFVDGDGRIVLFGDESGRTEKNLRNAEGLGALLDDILRARQGSYRYRADGDTYILHVNYLPELKWYLFVEQNEDRALAGARRTLYVNLAISLLVTAIVVALVHVAFSRYQERLETMASTDKLTGLLNRHAFTILLDRLLAEIRREPRPFCVLLADIDHFKAINDRHGHAVGDQVLREVARRLQSGLRESDLAVRWGGEEFLLLLKGCELAEAEQVADKLRVAVRAAPLVLEGHALRPTISIGVAQYAPGEHPDHAIDRADAALYQAKSGGRDRVAVAPVG